MVRELGVMDESDRVLAHDDTLPSTHAPSTPTSDVPMQPVDSLATVDSIFQITNDGTSLARARSLDVKSALNWLSSRTRGEQALLAAVVLAFSRLYLSVLNWGVILAAILGAGLGGFMVAFYLLAVPEDTRLRRASVIAKIGRYKSLHLEMVDGVPSWSDAEKLETVDHSFGIQLDEIKDVNYDKVDISPDIDPLVEDMISFTLRDFVNVPVGLASEGQHNVPLRKSLVAMAMNVSKKFSNVRLPETALLAVFGLQNSFIVHLRAYRELRASQQPIEEYVKESANPDSVIGRCYHKDERLKQFRSTARAVCQSLLSKNDQQSIALFSVMQEIMATHVLEATLEHLCDPDFINLSIIDYFTTPAKTPISTDESTVSKSAFETTPSSSEDTGSTPKEAPITSLADSILMNAATLMDQSTLDKHVSSKGHREPIQTPAASPKPHLQSQPEPRQEDGIDQQGTFEPRSPIPEKITLKRVLNNKNEHMELYQEFMEYLQLWDAMDLAQFWIMTDIFHRQIEQGTFTDVEDLRREAKNIHDSFCGPDVDQQLAGIQEAKGGAVLKNMRRSMQSNPANCLNEAQDWAMSVLDAQYWTPFDMKRSTSPSNQVRKQDSDAQPSLPSPTMTNLTSDLSSRPMSPLTPEYTASAETKQPIVNSIHMTDMVNRRPKTLMANSELSYMIEVQTQGGQGWMVTRSFQQLEQLQLSLVQQYPAVQRIAFPRWRLQPSDKVCNGLQAFLRSMLAIPDVASSTKLNWFLGKEFDLSTEEPVPPGSGLLPSLSPMADQTKNFGVAAAQGAKTALRQASEASLSAGRFFKSLGTVSPQAADEKGPRGSFDSVRSINSSVSAMTLSEHQTPSRSMDIGPHSDARQSSSSEFTHVNDTFVQSPLHNEAAMANSGYVQDTKDVLECTATGKSSKRSPAVPTEGLSSVNSASSMERTATPKVDTETDLVSTPANQEAPNTIKSTPKETQKMKLLTTDELDLLIETSFTVLEDMMDFSKGQSIRRMTFGMLRELVRKSYRVAINQSFSTWVEQTTSHEKVVEMVRWMKDDLFWPNGEWPTSATEPSPASSSPISQTEDVRRDVLHIGGELFEVGPDGIAVKISTLRPDGQSEQVGDSSPDSSPLAARTPEEREATRDKARELVKMMLPGSLVTVLGKEAVLRGLVDVFEMFQIKELNLGLALSVLEMTARLVLTR